MPRKKTDATKRFWSKVKIRNPNDCWIYQGSKYPGGYGQFWIDGKNIGAHVYSYILQNNEVPVGQFVCHSCDNPPCVNPDHLFLGTPTQNTHDMIAKGRLVKTRTLGNYQSGENNNQAKLSDKQVEEIRKFYKKGERGHGIRVLAEKYNVHPNTIYQIVNNLTRR